MCLCNTLEKWHSRYNLDQTVLEQREVVGNVNDDGLFLNRFGQLPPDWAVGTSCKL